MVAGLTGFLKGADAVVFAAAKHLKLAATLQPDWKGGEHDDGEDAGDVLGAQMGNIDDEEFVMGSAFPDERRT